MFVSQDIFQSLAARRLSTTDGAVPKVAQNARLLALLDEACSPLGGAVVGRVALGGLEIGELAGRLHDNVN